MIQAEELKQIDLDYRNHLQAWLSVRAKVEKRSGNKYKLVYDKFNKFYDYKDAIETVTDMYRKPAGSETMRKVAKFLEQKGGG